PIAPTNWQAGAGDSSILVIQNTSAWGLNMASFIFENFGIAATVINSSQIAATDFSPFDLIITVGDQSSSYYNAISANVAKFDEFVSQGGVVQYQLATQGDNVNIVNGVNVRFGNSENLNKVLLPLHPIAAGLPAELPGNSANHCYLSNLPPEAAIITATSFSVVPTTVEYQFGNGTVIATGMTWEYLYLNGFASGPILYNAVAYSLSLTGGVRWLSANPTSGIVPADSTLNIEVTFNAADLKGGNYRANIVISSNDPDSSRVLLPAHLHVTGAPVIAVSDTILPYGAVFIGVTVIDTLIVSSRGTDSLRVSSIMPDNPDYSVSQASFTLAPEESRAVEVSFTPSATGPRNGTLTIVSNDETNSHLTVPLTGEGVEPPVISVSPAAFEFRVKEGDSTTAVMTISNTGGSPLNFTIRDEEAPQAMAASGQKLYWTEPLVSTPDTLHRSNLDGSEVESIFTNNASMRGIAVDEVSGRLYWADRGDGTIRSSRLDGSDIAVLLSGVDALDLAIDHAGGKIYWTNFSSGTINQANLDGSGVKIIVQSAGTSSGTDLGPDADIAPAPAVRSDENVALLSNPWGIALDLTHGKVYWTEQTGNRLSRANLDGSGVETVVDTLLFGPRGIKLDVAGGKIYFVDSGNRAIKRAN
ncbi:MAG: choice-of-anchor D domain-containing protein, partial [bacterium]